MLIMFVEAIKLYRQCFLCQIVLLSSFIIISAVKQLPLPGLAVARYIQQSLISFTGVVSVTLNFHPQGRKGEKLKSRRPGSPCDSIRWCQALAALTPEPPGPTANSHNFPHNIPIPT